MKINGYNAKQIGGKQAWEVEVPGGVCLVSYNTPVACKLDNGQIARTQRYYSVTTTRHISDWLRTEARTIPQELLERLLAGDAGAVSRIRATLETNRDSAA